MIRNILAFLLITIAVFAEDSSIQLALTPPPNWRMAETKELPKHVKVLIVGKGKHSMPPSINLGYEIFSGSLKDYLKIIKNFNQSQGDPWVDLGTIETQAGQASLSQVEITTQWGPIKEMHVILARNGIIYIVTAAALKEEFSSFYPLFLEAFRSLHFVNQ